MKKILLGGSILCLVLLATAIPSEAQTRFYFGFSFGRGVPHYRPYSLYGHYPRAFRFGSVNPSRAYYYRSYSPPPVIYYAPHARYRPLPGRYGRDYGSYAPRRYHRRW